MASLAHKHADVGPFDKARDCEPMLQLAAAIGADGEFRVHTLAITRERLQSLTLDQVGAAGG